MRFQRGIAQGWLYLIGLIALVAAIAAAIHAFRSWVESIDERGYRRGVQDTTAAYAKRDNEALRKVQARVIELEARNEVLRLRHSEELASLDRKRLEEAASARKQVEKDLAAVRAGALRLRDPGARTECPAPGDRGEGAETRVTAGERDAAPGSYLSPEAAGFLLELASEADDVARQLGAAQAVILAQQKTCNSTGGSP